MITLKRVDGAVWRATSNDPQELAEANWVLTGAKPDPEGFPKDTAGRFYFEKEIMQFQVLPWDVVQLCDFRKDLRRDPPPLVS